MLAQTWRVLARPGGRPEPRDAADWFRAHGVTLAAVTLIGIQLWWKAALLAHSYFRQDDFSYLDHALAGGLRWKYLMFVDAGHLMPLGLAITWAAARVSLYNWPLASAVILVLLAAACFALLRLLRTLFGSRPAILIPLAVFLFSPLSLGGVAWWSAALEVLPLELAIFMATGAHVRYVRGGRPRHAVAAAGWLLLGMAATDKGAIVPLLLLALTSAFFVEGRWAAAVVTALTRYWRAWAGYGALLAGYCVVFFLRLPGSSTQPGDPGSAAHVAGFAFNPDRDHPAARGARRPVAVVGGRLRPSQPACAAPAAVLGGGRDHRSGELRLPGARLAGVGDPARLDCRRRHRSYRPRSAGRAVRHPAGRADQIPDRRDPRARRLPGAGVPAPGRGAGRLPLRPSGRSRRPAGRAGPRPEEAAAWRAAAVSVRVATLLVLGAFLIGSFWSLQSLESVTTTTAARSYIMTARAAVAAAPSGTLIVDGPTPAMIMDPGIFWRQGYTSQVIGALARGEPAGRLSWTLSPHGVIPGLMTFDGNGQLRPVAVEGPSSKPLAAHQRCWAVTSAGTRISLLGSLYRWPWTARLEYSGPATVLGVRFGGNWSEISVPAGRHAVYVPVVGAGSAVAVRLIGSGSGACLTGVTVGSLQPRRVGPAIPATPVPG